MPSFLQSFKPLAAVLTLTVATTGCIDLNDDDDDDSKGVTYQATATVGTVKAGVGEYTVTVTASDGSDLEGETVTVKPVMDMQNDGSINHGTPVSSESGELDENGQFKATGYFLMPSGEMGSWFLEVSSNDMTQLVPITVHWTEGGRANLYGGDDDKTGDSPRSYYLFTAATAEHMNMTHAMVYVAAKETMMSYKKVATGETLTGGAQDLQIATVKVEMCDADCTTAENWKTAENSTEGIYSATLMSTGLENIQVRLIVNGVVKTNQAGDADHATLSLTGSADSGHGHGM